MENHSNEVIVVGIICHVEPKNLSEFRNQIETSQYLKRLIIFKDSNDKLWLVGDAP